ncbi:MAG TPA: glycosyltransferase family 4 protein [Solirubrobacteraceae bacterium]|jgi:glycosyltransferase involved in cell wall biosynthesis
MRILIFHGYLLEGTGSNVYNARLAAALVDLGHEVHLLCQDRHPERQPFVDAVGSWEHGALHVENLRAPLRCTVYRPDIGDLLPVYVADSYEGIEARTFARCSAAEIDRYLVANVAAVEEVAARVRPQVALANHLIMGPVILARALGEVPYAVKVHGSALEYTVKADPERFLGFAREGLARARTVLVGSRHTARSLWEALADPLLPERTRLGPPGVDVHRFRPPEEGQQTIAPSEAIGSLAARLRAGAAAPAGGSGGAFARDEQAVASALEELAAHVAGEGGPLVVFVGKLIVSKGVDLLLAAWPLVLEQFPQATLAVVGFGAYRQALERLLSALGDGRLDEAIAIARAGRALESGVGDAPATASAPLRHLLAFLLGLQGEPRERYLRAARALPERVVLTGRLDHEELVELLPVCEALVVPSTFPEAFGMVAAEGAACGVLPVSAAHSGLAEVSEVLARAVPAEAARWLSFAVDDHAVVALADCLIGWLSADAQVRAQTSAGLVAAVREHWSWEGVARGVLAAAQGDRDGLLRAGDFLRSFG